MARYDQAWCDRLVADAGGAHEQSDKQMRVLYIVTDTEEGKVAFHLDFDADGATLTGATSGKLQRGEKADITVTLKESVFVEIGEGTRSRDAAFMRGDLKIEGAYNRWLDGLVPLFETEPWATTWSAASAA
jgi:putative sterol carrier protein